MGFEGGRHTRLLSPTAGLTPVSYIGPQVSLCGTTFHNLQHPMNGRNSGITNSPRKSAFG
jgi:hypothetical protein